MLVEIEKSEAAHLMNKIANRITASTQKLTNSDVQKDLPKQHTCLETLDRDIKRLQKLVEAYQTDAMSIFTGDAELTNVLTPGLIAAYEEGEAEGGDKWDDDPVVVLAGTKQEGKDAF